jgi:hypothetical protein
VVGCGGAQTHGATEEERHTDGKNWQDQLSTLVAQVEVSSRCPKDESEARRFVEAATRLLEALAPSPPGRLDTVRWAAMVFDVLYPPPVSTPPDEHAVDLLSALAEAVPDGVSDELQKRVHDESKRLATQKFEKLIKKAETYVDPNAGHADKSPTEMNEVYEDLEPHEADSRVPELRKALHREIVTCQAHRHAAALSDRWEALQGLRHNQPTVYESAISLLLAEVTPARVTVAAEGITPDPYEAIEKELRQAATRLAHEIAQREEQRQAKAMRRYQRWALGQIKQFEQKEYEAVLKEIHAILAKCKNSKEPFEWPVLDELPGLRKKLAEVAKVPYAKIPGAVLSLEVQRAVYQECAGTVGWKHDDELASTVLQEAMVKYLLPINLGLLELPVHERYQRAFQSGWAKLDGLDEQTYVAEQTATITKKSLQDFLED